MTEETSGLSLPKRFRKRAAPVGAIPGTLTVNASAQASVLDQTFIGGPRFEQFAGDQVDISAEPEVGQVHWLNVTGLADIELLRKIGAEFGLHDLTLEDVVNTDQRPNVDVQSDHMVIRTRMVRSPNADKVGADETEQVVMVLSGQHLLTFQEFDGDCFDPVRRRMGDGRPRMRAGDVGYIAYALLDASIDSFYPALERLGERLEVIEAEVIEKPLHRHIPEIHAIKQEIASLRRIIWPLRDVVRELIRFDEETSDAEADLIPHMPALYLRDCEDHVLQLLEFCDAFAQVANDVRDLYHTGVATRLNDIMRVLTIMASIFIPLGFIAGLYGMNFDTESPWNLPELGWRFGYLTVVGFMVTIAVGLLVFFKRRGWLDRDGLD